MTPALAAAIGVATGAALVWVLASWRDLAAPALWAASVAWLLAPPIGFELTPWVVAAGLLGLRALRGPVHGRLLLGSLAGVAAVHAAVAYLVHRVDSDAVMGGAAAGCGLFATATFALASVRKPRRPEVRWVGEIPVNETP